MTHRTKVLIRSMSRRVKIAHVLIAKVKKRIWPVKRPLATGGERRKPVKRNVATTTKTSQPGKKSKVGNFFTLRRLLNRNMIIFAGRSRSKNTSTRERVDSS